MIRIVVLLAAVVAAAVTGSAAVWAAGRKTQTAGAPQAPATIQRTFVSTSGSDANPCTATQPCRNFSAGIAQATAGGEVVALDSGGYGAFTINKPITIAGAPGAHVAITAFAGTGIDIAAGASDTVILRHLYVKGLGGQTGISFTAGAALYLDRVDVVGFNGVGLDATAAGAKLTVRDSSFRANGGQGLDVAAALTVEVADSRAEGNGTLGSAPGFRLTNGARGSFVRASATGNSNAGFVITAGAVVSISQSLADRDYAGVQVFGEGARASIAGSTLSNNEFEGLIVIGGGGAAVGRISGSLVTGNAIGLANGSTLESFGDNLVRGNTTETSGTITVVGKT